MPRFPRREPLPEPVSAVAAQERVLAWAPCDDGGYVVASDAALHVPTRSGEPHRIGWEHVDRAVWEREDAILTVTEEVPGARPVRHVLPIEDPGDLTIVVRQRVNATVVLSRDVELDGSHVTVVARRPPGSETLTWTVRLQRGVDPRDPATRQRIDAALEELRAEVGQ